MTQTEKIYSLTGKESFDIEIENLTINATVKLTITYQSGEKKETFLKLKLDTEREIKYFKNGSIFKTVFNEIYSK